MDEAVCAVDLGLLSEEKLVKFVKHKPRGLEIVMTGHHMTDALFECADYVTEMTKVKHPYDTDCFVHNQYIEVDAEFGNLIECLGVVMSVLCFLFAVKRRKTGKIRKTQTTRTRDRHDRSSHDRRTLRMRRLRHRNDQSKTSIRHRLLRP